MKKLLTIFSIVLLVIIFFFSIFLGAEKISLNEIKNIFSKDSILSVIIFNLRLPRSILVMLCGALLAGSGVLFQGFFRNGLADAGLIGISSGATLGAVLSTFIPITFFSFVQYFISTISVFAFFGAIISGLLIYYISKKILFFNSSINILLVGSALSAFFSSLTSILILMRDRELHKIYVWTLGSFNGKTWDDVFFVLFPAFLSFVFMQLCCNKLDIIAGGEKTAESLGLNVSKFRMTVLLSGCLATATGVCCGGTVGFIGLIAPHIVRKFFSPNHKRLLPLSMIFGSLLLLLCDTIARIIISPAEIPVGIITSLIGGPFFIFVIIGERRKGYAGN